MKVSLKYIPIKMELDPSESINNMGQLRVDVLDATDLPSADRNGKSDPYCRFELNGQEVYKTKVQKKTLHPAWNEFFEVNVPSRTGAKFNVKVYDYDFADKPDFLGGAELNLETMEPFKASEARYMLDGKSGTVRLRFVFRPDYVKRMRQGTSQLTGTFAAPGRIVTGVAGAPIKGGVAVAGVVGSGVGKGATFLRRGIMGKKRESSELNGSMADSPPVVVTNGSEAPTGETGSPAQDRPMTSNGATLSHDRTRSIGAASIHSSMAHTGSATFTVVSASGFPPAADLYIVLSQTMPKEKTIGKTKHFKASGDQWNFDETFKFSCAADAQFKIEAKGDHTFGSDDVFGQHPYFVDDSGSGAAKDLTVGSGTVTLKSVFQAAESNLSADSPRGNMRRSFLSKRDPRNSRESTPTA